MNGCQLHKKMSILLDSICVFKTGYTRSFPYSVKHARKADWPTDTHTMQTDRHTCTLKADRLTHAHTRQAD